MHPTRTDRARRRVLALVVASLSALGTTGAAAARQPGSEQTASPVPGDGPGAARVERDVAYGPDPAHLLDVHLPTGGGNRGVIVLVHGGGFVSGSRGELFEHGGPVVRQLERGFAMVDVEYRLTDGERDTFPAAVEDVSLALAWVRTHGAAHGLVTDTVLVAGSSAGGTIAALVGLAGNDPPGGPVPRPGTVDGWISLAGIHDLVTPGGAAHFGVTWLGSASPDPALLAAASPLTHLDGDDPPGYVVHGDHDTVVPVAQAEAMLAAGELRGLGDRLTGDVVDRGPGSCRWHFPGCGMDRAAFDAWVDRVTARRV